MKTGQLETVKKSRAFRENECAKTINLHHFIFDNTTFLLFSFPTIVFVLCLCFVCVFLFVCLLLPNITLLWTDIIKHWLIDWLFLFHFQYGTPSAGGVAHIPPGWDNWIGLVSSVRFTQVWTGECCIYCQPSVLNSTLLISQTTMAELLVLKTCCGNSAAMAWVSCANSRLACG